jgi:hypothetical protein
MRLDTTEVRSYQYSGYSGSGSRSSSDMLSPKG